MIMDEPTKRKNRVTIKDVARAADVSIATVSYVLNNAPGHTISEETRKKVLQFANILGYECNVMARYLATGKTNSVAAVVSDVAPFASQYYLKLLTELSRLLARRNYELRLVDYDDALGSSSNCDAYITLSRSEREFRAFADTKYVPVIAIDSEFDDFLFYRVNDDFSVMYGQARSELGTDRIDLLTFRLPDECLERAKSVFDGVTVVDSLASLRDIPADRGYATVSKSISDNAPASASVKYVSESFALKASAAADAAIKAINRVRCSDEDHDIKV